MLKYKLHKKLLFLFIVFCCAVSLLAADIQAAGDKKAKYVFLFIGDGMGPLQRSTAEKAFKSSGQNELWMNTLPVKGAVSTLNYSGVTTDSAAAATALACGFKTHNGILGLDHNGQAVESIAETAKKQGWKVGIVTSVELNHATPAGFYAHRMKRYMYDEIIQDLAASNFEYFGGGTLKIKGKPEEVLAAVKKNGYIMLDSPRKMPELDPDKKYIVHTKMPYVIDRTANSGLSLADFTRLGIRHLYSGEGRKKGFFMMVEGGKIDWSGHANDAGGLIWEVKAFDEAVKAAVDFYKEHPDSTLIVVVADHETGGLHASLSGVKAGWTPARLKTQEHSYDFLKKKLAEYKKQELPFEEVVSLLKENFRIKKFSDSELKELSKAWDIYTASEEDKKKAKTVYGSYNPLILCMQHIFAGRSGLKWTTTAHSALAVPLSAIGVDAKEFAGYYGNNCIADKLRAIIKASAGN